MKIRRIVASLLGATMMAASIAAPVLAATTLGEFPGFLFTADHKPAYTIVVGANAQPSDVVGAIDVATRLAGESYEEVTVTSTVSEVNGLMKEDTEANLATNFFDKTIKPWQFTKLKDTTITYQGDDYRIVEEIHVPKLTDGSTTVADIKVKTQNDEGDDIDAYYYLNIPASMSTTDALYYKLTFKEDIDLEGQIDRTLDVDVLGTRFSIINVTAADTIDALVGKINWLGIGEEATYDGGWSVKVLSIGENNDAEVAIYKDGVEKERTVLAENEETSVEGFKVRVLDVYLQKYPEETGKVKIVAGEETRKAFTDGDDFPGNDEWKLELHFQTPGKITAGDYIEVYYQPEEDKELAAGEYVELPGDYGKLKFDGLTDTKTIDIEIAPTTKVLVYTDDTFDTKVSTTSLPALQIKPSEDYALSFGSEDYKNLWLAVDESNSKVYLVAYDDKEGKYYNITTPIDYSDRTDSETFDIKVTVGDHEYTLRYAENATTSGVNAFTGDALILDYDNTYTADDDEVIMAFQYSAGDDKWILGSTKAEAEANDVLIGTTTEDGIGTFEKTYLVEKTGVKIANVKNYADSDKVKLTLGGWETAPEFKMVFGEETSTTTAGETVKKVVPIKTPVAKLDTEVGVDENGVPTEDTNFVLVGGPCVNTLVAKLAEMGKFRYACDTWPGENFGIIEVIDDAFKTGKVAMVVAGTRAEDTRMATTVLMKYDEYLSGVDKSAVKITSVSSEGIVPLE